MRKIAPCLWFDNQAEKAARFYTGLFEHSNIVQTVLYGDHGPQQKGTVMSVTFTLQGQDFTALNGGPAFPITPAISFYVSCKTEKEVDTLWKKLSDGGKALMELQQYPFSKRFGWVADRFGVSWQLSLTGTSTAIAPFFMFVGKQHGKANEAMDFYVSLFKSSKIDRVERYGAGEQGPAGTVKHASFTLAGQPFMAIDSNAPHPFTFTPGISLFVSCETQGEIDRLWEKLADGGEEVQCGWVTDRYGVSWQIVPANLGELLGDGTSASANRVMKAVLTMIKLDMKELQRAAEA
jgi:predicted 3-demethylubiquinone-9 3-methyltransferase (glyoxalase superfamily)